MNKHIKQNISQGKEREGLIMFSFWENHMNSPFKTWYFWPEGRRHGIVL